MGRPHHRLTRPRLLDAVPVRVGVGQSGCFTAPAVETVRRTLGEDTRLTLRSIPLGTQVTYPDLTSIEDAALESRIWGGLHFRDAMDDSYTIGHVVAHRVLDRLR